MERTVTIHLGATRATLDYPEGSIDLNSLHGSERSAVRRAVVDAFCKYNGISQEPIKTKRKRRSRK